jgi:hypothetical protein
MSEAADDIRRKIRALLALAANNDSEAQASAALAKASALMAKYNLSVSLDDDEASTVRGEFRHYGMTSVKAWHIWCADAAAYLYNCRSVITHDRRKRKTGHFQFVGRPDSVDACEATLVWLLEQVESLYKTSLPRGMTKAERAEYRRTFKDACALRIKNRAWRILEAMANDDALAIEATGQRALVVKSQQEQLFAEADELLKDAKALVLRKRYAGTGTAHGLAAGEAVKLNESVGASRLQIEHKRS